MARQINILDIDDYYRRFDELHVELRSQRMAWKELEEEMFDLYGVHRYSSFESFKSARSRRHKGKRKGKDIFR